MLFQPLFFFAWTLMIFGQHLGKCALQFQANCRDTFWFVVPGSSLVLWSALLWLGMDCLTRIFRFKLGKLLLITALIFLMFLLNNFCQWLWLILVIDDTLIFNFFLLLLPRNLFPYPFLHFGENANPSLPLSLVSLLLCFRDRLQLCFHNFLLHFVSTRPHLFQHLLLYAFLSQNALLF